MVRGSKVAVEIIADTVPFIEGALEFAAGNVIPGGTLSNMKYVDNFVKWSSNISQIQKIILCDAQTSGGLLVSVPEESAQIILKQLYKVGIQKAEIIGKIINKDSQFIKVT